MSYDYLLFRAPRTSFVGTLTWHLGGKMGKLMSMAKAIDGPAIGDVEEVKKAISVAFPNLTWRKTELKGVVAMPRGDVRDWSWCALGGPEVRLGATSGGKVRFLSVSHADIGQVKKLANQMKLRIIDEQAFGG